jgi:SAM-dependent methyltransferase
LIWGRLMRRQSLNTNDLSLNPNAWLRWEVVAHALPAAAHDVLEVGCGQGAFAVRLARRYRYVGLEPDARSFEAARDRLARHVASAEVRNGDLSALAPDEAFDLVCAFEVIEHMEDDRGALETWVDRVRPGGSLVVSTPASQHRFAAWDEMVGHFRRYDADDLRALLTNAGLEEVRVNHFGAPLGYPLEALRNAIARQRVSRSVDESPESRTARSGRLMEPAQGVSAVALYLFMLPFRKLQLAFPNHGTGLVAVGRRPPG